jgi:hypothetical protein
MPTEGFFTSPLPTQDEILDGNRSAIPHAGTVPSDDPGNRE